MASEPEAPAVAAASRPALQSSNRGWNIFPSTKGLSVITTGAVLITAIVRADTKDIPEIIRIIVGSGPWAATGWILAMLVTVVAVIMVPMLTRINERELQRVLKERDELQTKLLERQGGKNV